MPLSEGAHLVGGQRAALVHAAAARDFYAPIVPVVVELRDKGLSLRAIARELTRRGIQARYYSDRWSASQVRRILARAAAMPPVSQPDNVPTMTTPNETTSTPIAAVAQPDTAHVHGAHARPAPEEPRADAPTSAQAPVPQPCEASQIKARPAPAAPTSDDEEYPDDKKPSFKEMLRRVFN